MAPEGLNPLNKIEPIPVISAVSDLGQLGSTETLKIPEEKVIEVEFIKKQEFDCETPVVTLADDQRKNSEPIMSRQKSDVQITPIEDISGNNMFSDMLGGYVTLADESASRLPKDFLRQMKSGVEISSFDDGVESKEETLCGANESEDDRLSQRVMSIDSNDSIVTVKELEHDLSDDKGDEALQVEIEDRTLEEKVEEKSLAVKAEVELQSKPEELDTSIDDGNQGVTNTTPVELNFEPIDDSEIEAALSQLKKTTKSQGSNPFILQANEPIEIEFNESSGHNFSSLPNQQQVESLQNSSNIVESLTDHFIVTPTNLEPSTFETSVSFVIIPTEEGSDIPDPILSPIEHKLEAPPIPERKSVSFISSFELEPQTNEDVANQKPQESTRDVATFETFEISEDNNPKHDISGGTQQAEQFVSEICQAAEDVVEKVIAETSLEDESEEFLPTAELDSSNEFKLTEITEKLVTDNPELLSKPVIAEDQSEEAYSEEQIRHEGQLMQSKEASACVSLEPELTMSVSELEIILPQAKHNDIQKCQFSGEITATLQPEMVETEEMETDFIPAAEPLSVPPIESSSSPLQIAVLDVAVETIASAIQKESEDNKPVETPGSEKPTTSTAPTESFTPDTDKQALVTTDETEDKLSAKPHELLGDVQEVSIDQPCIVVAEPQLSREEKAISSEQASVVISGAKPDLGGRGASEQEKQTHSYAPNNESGQRDRDARDVEIDMLRKRLEETEAAMERIVAQMGSVSNRLSPSILAQVLKAQGVRQEDLEKRKEPKQISTKSVSSSDPQPSKPSSVKSQSSVEKEVKFQLPPKDSTEEEEEEEEEEVVRPPTPPRTLSKKSKHRSDSSLLSRFAHDLSESVVKQSAAAAIAAAKSQGPSASLKDTVSVIGFEETAELQSGEKWDDRTPTPTFRMATPPVPHRAPTPPEDIPSIFLEGPMPTIGQQLIVSDQISEIEGDYPDNDFDQISNPIVLSGKVTLSVISGGGPEETTEASSLSYDDRAQAGSNKPKVNNTKKDGLASAIKTEKGLSSAKKSSPVSSHDMTDYEVVKKGGFTYDEDNDDVDITSYMTAETDGEGQQKVQEDTAGDISVMDGLEDGRNDELPNDDKDEE